MTKDNGSKFKSMPLSKTQSIMIRSCNKFLRCIERDCDMPGLKMDFSKRNGFSHLIGLFTSRGLRGMLQGIKYQSVDLFLPLVAQLVDRSTRFFEQAAITRVHSSYSKLGRKVMDREECLGFDIYRAELFSKEVKEFKELVVKSFDVHCNIGLHSLRFHLLD